MIDKMRKIFNKVDPAGVFFDENIDEYDSEIKELISLSLDYNDEKALFKILRDIFARYFEGIDINQDLISELSQEISKEFGG